MGTKPDEVMDIAYKLEPQTGWKPHTEEEIEKSRFKALRRLNLAGWITLGCGNSTYVKNGNGLPDTAIEFVQAS